MPVEDHRDKVQPLRILIVGAENLTAADLFDGLHDEDRVRFVRALPGPDKLALEPEPIDVIVVAAQHPASPVIGSLRSRDGVSSAIPTIALCNGSVQRMVEWLESAVDDVDHAPIPRPLLVARVERIRRGRATPAAAEPRPPSVMQFGPIRMDLGSHEVSVDGKRLHLTPTEYRLLELLTRNSGVCLTRDAILDHVWGIGFDTGTNLVDMYIYFVRKRLKDHGLTGVVKTVRGAGYRFVSPEEQ